VTAPAEPGAARDGVVVWLSGAPWDAVAGTDRHLVTALAQRRPVLWADPPVSWLARRRRRQSAPRLSEVAPGVTRVHTVCLPGVTRPVLRRIARVQVQRNVRAVLRARHARVYAVVATTLEPVLRGWRGVGRSVYHATDDFVAGAGLLGASGSRLARARADNVAAADVVTAVSGVLARELGVPGRPAVVLPNGCDPDFYAAADGEPPAACDLPHPVLGLVGQLNDRLDLRMLEAVADAGYSLLLVGPRYEEAEDTRRRLDLLQARPNVRWVGRRPLEEMPSWMAAMDVGLTPYTDTPFNRASCPLKTLDYLAAGLPVVSTDLPAARELGADLVRLASDPAGFVAAVREVVAAPAQPREARRTWARRHSWTARARQLDDLIAAISERADAHA
jgi:teichuronic acid biosynthesis glycosyltransferase TuaH